MVIQRKTKFDIEVNQFHLNFSKFKDKRMVIYGIGRRTATLLPELGEYNIVGLLDRNPSNIGKLIGGYKVLSLDGIQNIADLIVINSDPTNYQIIFRRIEKDVNIPVFFGDGRPAAIEIKNDSYVQNPYWNISEEMLRKKINEADIVSFDLFDTLIVRKIFSPEDIYSLVGKKAKKEYHIDDFDTNRATVVSCCNACATLWDIYHMLQKQLNLSDEIREDLYEYEWKLEHKLCKPRNVMVDMLKYALQTEKDVYIVTDMYYEKNQIIELLKSLGIDDILYENIWISCEKKADKITGSMWDMFHRNVIRTRKCLHIGDNKLSDIEMPKKYGIDTFYIMSSKDMLLQSSIGALAASVIQVEDSVCLGLISAKLFNNPFSLEATKGKVRMDDCTLFGYCTYGPVITKFLVWLYFRSCEDDIARLCFFARDGYFLEKDYEWLRYMVGYQSEQEHVYLPISRRLLLITMINNMDDFEQVVKFPFVGTFAQFMDSRFNIIVDERSREQNGIEITSPVDFKALMEWTKLYKNEIIQEIECERKNYLHYLQTNGIINSIGKMGVVDLGYYGTNQYYFQKLINQKVEGYCLYACLSEKNEYMKDMYMKGCFQKPDDPDAENSLVMKKNMAVETFLTAPHGMVRYIDAEGKVICEADKKSQLFFSIKEEVNEGVLDYMKDYVSIVNLDGENIGIEEIVFYHMLDGKVDISKEILKGFYFDNDFIGGEEGQLEV